VLCAAFLFLKFNFVIFWHKNNGAKAAHKMLVKLTSEELVGGEEVAQRLPAISPRSGMGFNIIDLFQVIS